MQRGLKRGEFKLWYQPQVDLATDRVVAVEGLLRWFRSNGERITPDRFISEAESNGAIVAIGAFALEQACEQLQHWSDSGIAVPRVSVNVSICQLYLSDFSQTVASTLACYRFPADRLTLEITETTFGKRSEQVGDQIKRLRQTGVRLSLDDFGTGYATLDRLRCYPVDEIKLDRCFVEHAHESRVEREITRSTIQLASALDLDVVAEGVANEDIRDTVKELGWPYAQGFLFAKPQPSDALARMLGIKHVPA